MGILEIYKVRKFTSYTKHRAKEKRATTNKFRKPAKNTRKRLHNDET